MSSPASGVPFRTAFVTGASTGLGRAFCDRLLAEGVEVWGTARDRARLPARAGFHPVVLDLADGAAAEAAFAAAEREAGGFDLVINNAGYGVFGGFADTDFAVWQRQMEVMLVHTARLAHAALRGLVARRRGALVNVSSLAAEFPLPFQPAYNVVKAGLSALSESLMFETQGSGVCVIDFRPGDYRTDFEGSVQRPPQPADPRRDRVWAAFARMMAGGPAPERAADDLWRALRRGRSGTVRTGRAFQAVVGPFLARLGPLALRRRVLAWYHGL
ncbi:MAG: SDR family NAD(P)-dependent oxidoreductase [Opitutaceae bacterium]|nr:SDR family NAD(P)-dependent oxidoreductase [Opitutaceae bacterium]